MLLSHGPQTAEVTVEGGRVLTYAVAGVPVLTPLDLPDRAYRSALLAPWPNRVADGTWSWQGTDLTLAIDEPDRGTALHGLVARADFRVIDRAEDRVVLVHDLAPSAGYPFALRVSASYTLTDDGLVCALHATNTGSLPAPVALGVHPYLHTRGLVDDTTLTVPATRVVETDLQWQETGRPLVDGSPWDLRAGRRMGPTAVDACWTELLHDADGAVRCALDLPGGDRVVVWGGPTCRYVVVYDSDLLDGAHHRTSIAVEPNTAGANALRSGTDLDVLEPGQALTLDWGLQASWG